MSPVMTVCSGCGRIIDPRQKKRGKCPACLSTYYKTRRQQRGSTAQRGYGSDYQRRRAAAIKAQPWCSDCGHVGSVENPLTAEHITPVAKGGKYGPLAVLCRSCNSSRGGAMNSGRGSVF
jgi:5-methylcytosine-specific restriction endonuclease McrA